MKTVTNKLVNGYKVEMDPSAEFIIHEIWDDLFYDKDYRIREGDTVVDIGANIGIFSLFAAHRGAKVYAVEPDRQNFKLLCKNIESNGLSDRVQAFCCAVAKHDGTIALYVPDARGLCASGLITTSLKQLEHLSENDRSQVGIARVKAVSLPAFLKKTGESVISLLKLDTEGAELDILAGATADDLKGVKRIVMETHAAYAERDLYHLVKRLGFDVVGFDKLAGPFANGYLYAVRAKAGSPAGRSRPVAVLTLPDSVVLPNEVIADAGASFSTVHYDGGCLGYRFDVDGEMGGYSTETVRHIRFTQPGLHRVSLEVLEGGIDTCRQKDMPAGFISDRTDKNIWVFTQEYGRSENALPLPLLGKKYEFEVSAKSDFIIPAAGIPKQWDYEALGLGIGVIDSGDQPEAPEISFLHNGESVKIASTYREIMIPSFPRRRDLCFSLTGKKNFKVCLHWFAKESGSCAAPPVLDCRNKRKQRLGEKSLAHICLLEGEGCLVVHRDVLPTTWNPKCVKICFSVHESDTTGRELEGELLFKGRCYGLQGWYKEIHFRGEDIRDSMEYTLRVPCSRTYQVTWWPE
jgi:FkbM family methyltransferase